MARLGTLLAGIVLGAAAGALGAHAWQSEPEPVVVQAPAPEEAWDLQNDLVRLETENARLLGEAGTATERAGELTDELARLTAENAALQAKLTETASQLTVAESAKEHLAQELAAAQDEAGALRQNLAFFEELIPEGSKPASVSIRSVDVTRQPGGLQFRVLVMRNGPADRDFEGAIQFLATGTRDGESATIALERVASAPTSTGGPESTSSIREVTPATLRFRQYQRVSGTLAVPAGFEPESVTVRVLEGKSVRSEHTVGLAK